MVKPTYLSTYSSDGSDNSDRSDRSDSIDNSDKKIQKKTLIFLFFKRTFPHKNPFFI